MNRRWTAWCLPAIWLVLTAAAQDAPRERVPLHIGFGRTSFLNVNLTDAKAAFKVFTRSAGEKRGYDLDVTVHTFDSDEAFRAAVTNNRLHLVIMVSWDYLLADLGDYIEPGFLSTDSNQGPRDYLVLVNANSPYQHLRDLRGKKITLLENTNCEMSQNWLSTLMLEEALGEQSSYFGQISTETRAAKAMLPVFFNQVDACVVNRPVLEMMSELNPQVGRRLRVIAESAPLVDALTCVAKNGWLKPYHREHLMESLRTLHKDPHGQQIMTLFKSDRLMPFDENYLTGTRSLLETYERLSRKEDAP